VIAFQSLRTLKGRGGSNIYRFGTSKPAESAANFLGLEKGVLNMKSASGMPSDLDYQAKKKWRELVGSVDVDADLEMLSNYCRQHSSLLAIRRERTRQQKSGKFQQLVKGRDGTMTLNPLVTAENRMVASLNRMLQTLGLASREQTKGRRSLPTPRPHWASVGEGEPSGGWAIEAALCGFDHPSGQMNENHPDHSNFKRRLM
jgi:phage terminase small subunit